MNTWEILLTIWIMINIVVFCVFVLSDAFGCAGFCWLNPLVIYESIEVNWFGAILLCLIGNILFLPYALIYWIYKLCTVGRNT